jgi:glycosyltransferase involved in cell wall biosynthesis
MRVGLDATPLGSGGGLQRYAAELARALAAQFPGDDYVLVSDQPFEAPAGTNLRRGGGPRNALERRWWSWGLNRELGRQRCDVFHGVNFEAPYLPLGPSVVTVHDLSPWSAWGGNSARVRRRTPAVIGLGLATMIVTPTEAIRCEVRERFRVPASRVAAVPEAAAEVFRPVEGGSRPPYFLFAGTLEERKNIGVLVEAWREFLRRCGGGTELVLAGRAREGFAAPAEPGIRVAGEVSDAELAALYSGALALLYPSRYEGFGLPVVEAMQCGAPVIAARIAAIEEVAGEAALLVDPGEARLWAEAMALAAGQAEWRAERRARSLARAAGYSWAETARRTREVYVEAIGRFAG